MAYLFGVALVTKVGGKRNPWTRTWVQVLAFDKRLHLAMVVLYALVTAKQSFAGVRARKPEDSTLS